MKKITKYECEVCHRQCDTEAEANDCEAIGKPNPQDFPIHVIVQFADDSQDIYWGLSFCVDKWKRTGEGYYAHDLHASMWACRDNYAGDSLGKEHCGTDRCYHKISDFYNGASKVRDMKSPHFCRMVNYLRLMNIPVRYWNGKEIVTLSDAQINKIIKRPQL